MDSGQKLFFILAGNVTFWLTIFGIAFYSLKIDIRLINQSIEKAVYSDKISKAFHFQNYFHIIRSILDSVYGRDAKTISCRCIIISTLITSFFYAWSTNNLDENYENNIGELFTIRNNLEPSYTEWHTRNLADNSLELAFKTNEGRARAFSTYADYSDKSVAIRNQYYEYVTEMRTAVLKSDNPIELSFQFSESKQYILEIDDGTRGNIIIFVITISLICAALDIASLFLFRKALKFIIFGKYLLFSIYFIIIIFTFFIEIFFYVGFIIGLIEIGYWIILFTISSIIIIYCLFVIVFFIGISLSMRDMYFDSKFGSRLERFMPIAPMLIFVVIAFVFIYTKTREMFSDGIYLKTTLIQIIENYNAIPLSDSAILALTVLSPIILSLSMFTSFLIMSCAARSIDLVTKGYFFGIVHIGGGSHVLALIILISLGTVGVYNILL